MISFVLAASLALAAAQPSAKPARDAYNKCLRTLIEQGLEQKQATAAFDAALAGACKPQEASLRAALVAQMAGRATAAEAQAMAEADIQDYRESAKERYTDSSTPEGLSQ